MPDLMWEKRPLVDTEQNVARVIRGGATTLVLFIEWDQERRAYVIHEEGSDETLEYSDAFGAIYRLADMYLEGFREGYDRGYESAEAEHTKRDAVIVPDPYRIRRNPRAFARSAEGDRRDRDDGEGHAEGDGPG